ncbi:hypothetical protein BGZ75_005856 [Mortierella antarctica]|nr:hypothetical protein BGZ75_005856 [Mortierella antarctica]
MTTALSSKEQQKTLKATLKAIEQDYKNKLRDAEKKCNDLRREAEKVAERERAEAKAKKEKVDKAAKDEYQLVKTEASEVHILLVLDLVKTAILDLKARNLNNPLHPQQLQQQQQQPWHGSLCRSSSSSSSRTSCSSSQSGLAKEDAEIKEWIEYAADRLEVHMSKSQVRQRLLEEIATAALERQHQAQRDAERRTEELQRQIEQLQQQQRRQEGAVSISVPGMDVPPPSYVKAVGPVGVGESDYSVYGDKKH